VLKYPGAMVVAPAEKALVACLSLPAKAMIQ